MFLFLSNLKCYPWLETDANAAASLVGLYAQLTDTLHHKFRGGSSAGLCSRTSERLVSLLPVLWKLFMTCTLQIDCSQAREELCGCVWCSTVRAAPHLERPSTFSTCTTHTSAACPGDTCTPTLSSWSSFSMQVTLPPLNSWPLTPPTLHTGPAVHDTAELVNLRLWSLASGPIISCTSHNYSLTTLFLETSSWLSKLYRNCCTNLKKQC